MVSFVAAEDGPEYGRRLIPTLVDELAASKPDHIYALIPRNQDFIGGFENLTYRTLARAIDRAAFWIESKVGKSVDFETIAYIGPMDPRYYIVAIAATKVGYKTLLPSPRNSVDGHLALLESTRCNILISPAESKALKRSYVVTSLNIINTTRPKPIILYHGGMATVDGQHLITPLNRVGAQIKVHEGHVRAFTGLPPFHVAGVSQTLLVPLYFGETTVWPPIGRPMNVDLIDDLLRNANVDILFLAPSTLEEISQSQKSLEQMKKVQYVQYGGGPLGKTAGDKISRYTKLLNAMGSSEVGSFPLLHKDPEDWIYFHFDPRQKGIEFREVGPGLYEQIFTRHDSTDPLHWSFYTFPDLSEFSMNDLYSKHPLKPDLWLYEGRSDDVIVFSNGEKFNPNDMEAILRSCPGIHSVLVVGQGRFRTTALLELKGNVPDTGEVRKEILDSISPYVTIANESAPAYARLDLDYIFFTKAGMPMLRTDKGTVKRRATNELYKEEIDQFYVDVEGLGDSSDTIQLSPKDQDTLRVAIRKMLTEMDGLQEITSEQDFFAAGMDSLQVMNLVRQLRSSLRDHDGGAVSRLISPRTIYSNPNISKLAIAVQFLTDHGKATSEGLEKDRISKMEELLAKYSHSLPQPKVHNAQRQEQDLTVVLTGSTGSLGSYLLDCLLANSQVTKVVCLNRGVDSEIKQKNVNQSRGLITEWGGKAQFLTSDLSKGNLGLNANDYQLLVNETSFIIHNQWQVDFNLNLESFEPHIAGVRELIVLSNQSPKSPPILFTSSISTLDDWAMKYPKNKVSESAFYDFGVPAAMGYGESKYIAEQLLGKAGKDSNVSAAICRVG